MSGALQRLAAVTALRLRKCADLRRDPNNARTHSPEQIEEIRASIRRFGFVGAIAEAADMVRAGNGRHEALEGMWAAGETVYLAPGRDRGGKALPNGTIPTVDCTGWSEDELTAYALADNKIALNAGWDDARLADQLRGLIDQDFEIEIIGFDSAELDKLLASIMPEADPEAVPDAPQRPVSRQGDLWLLGDHRIIVGSATDPNTVGALLAGEKPNLMVTDPPYGVNYDPKWREESLATWKAPRATGKVQNDDRADWTEAWALFPGNVAYVWHGGLHAGEVERSLEACGFAMRAQIIWAKQHFVISRGDYHWAHEPCWYAVRKGKPGGYYGDRKQSTLWQIANASAMGGDLSEGATGHGTQKPIECMRRPIEHNSKRGEAVYEPFSGSFTTGIACEMTGRRCLAVEIDPAYVDVAVLRWQTMTGREAVLQGGGTYAETAKEREPQPEAA